MIFIKNINKVSSVFSEKITSQICSSENYGINWIYNKNRKIVLYYESGETGSRGTLQLLKSYFIGYYNIKNNVTKMKGIIISGPVILACVILAFIFEIVFLDIKEILYSCIFYMPILIWIYFGEKKNRESISDYLDKL
ncbi:MAG: hypothetical protein ACI4HN_07315 [Ruminococcus sp.]